MLAAAMSQPAVAPARSPSLLERVLGGWVRQVDGGTLRADALAGLLGTVLALPQGIAFATLAGLPVEMGIYSAIVPTLVAALFGSSWHVVSGPTNALSLALLSMLAPLAATGSAAYVQLALAVTLLVGVMQWLIGALRLGALANFISPTALFGFTAGAALLIAIYALVDALGVPAQGIRGAPAVLRHLVLQWHAVSLPALAVAVATLGVSLALRWRWPRSPHMLIGLVAGTLLAVWLRRSGLADEGLHQVGPMPSPWPQPRWPLTDWSRLPELVGLAFAMTIVALGQTISIAKAMAARSGQRMDANREFMGQGLANVIGSFFSCYVSCGSLNRSVPNLQAGARTPLAAVFSALFMLVLVGAVSGWLAHIPMASIAALLLLVAWNLFDLPRWRELLRVSRRDFWIAAATLVATVTLRLEMAIVLGTLLSLMVFLHRTSRPAMRTMGFDRPPHAPHDERRFVVLDPAQGDRPPECPQLKLLRMEGEVYFGALQHVADTLHALREAPGAPRHLLVMGKSMNFIDLAGAELWAEELKARRAMGGDLYFHRPRPEVLQMWQRIGFDRALGADHVFPDKASAIAAIVPRLDSDICGRCRVRIFKECEARPLVKENMEQA